MKRLAVLGLIVLAGWAIRAQGGTAAGKSELQLQGSLSNISNSENDDQVYSAAGQLVYSYFIAPQLSIGGTARLQAQRQDPEEGDETTTSSLFLLGRADLYLTDGSAAFVPYIGGHGGVVQYKYETEDADEDSTTVAIGGHGGFKIFASEQTSWNIEGDITTYKPDVDDEDAEDMTITTISVLLGFSYYF